MIKSNTDEFNVELPDTIVVSPKVIKPRRGRPTTEQSRRRHASKNRTEGKATGKIGWYSDKTKMDVACTFAVVGNSRRVSELTGVNEATIRTWKTTQWWNEIQARIIKEQDEELDTKLTKLVDKAVAEVNDRLEHGDYVYNAKEDKLVRKPVGAKDLAVVTAITIDKRQLMRGQPTSRVEKVSQDEQLKLLAAEFRKMAIAKDITAEVEYIVDA